MSARERELRSAVLRLYWLCEDAQRAIDDGDADDLPILRDAVTILREHHVCDGVTEAADASVRTFPPEARQ